MIRFFDLIFSTLGILVLFPILLIIAIILRFSGEGEVFFLQERIGLNGTNFFVYKFTTMLKNSENMEGGLITQPKDKRVLPIGKFLRKTKINELPQLINVLFGSMSIIGPRPLSGESYKKFSKEGRELIFSRKPGLSGIGSIFFRNEENLFFNTENPHKFYEEYIIHYKEKLEIWFVKDKKYISKYFIFIFITITAIIFPKFTLSNLWSIYKTIPRPPKAISDKLSI